MIHFLLSRPGQQDKMHRCSFITRVQTLDKLPKQPTLIKKQQLLATRSVQHSREEQISSPVLDKCGGWIGFSTVLREYGGKDGNT
jgi:hypothetical protein